MFYQFIREKPKLDFPKTFYFMITVGWLVILFSIGKILAGVGIGSQRTKKSIIFLVWFFFLSALSILVAPEISTKYFSAMAIPAAVFCSNYFANIKKEWWAEFLFLLMLSSLFVNLLFQIFLNNLSRMHYSACFISNFTPQYFNQLL